MHNDRGCTGSISDRPIKQIVVQFSCSWSYWSLRAASCLLLDRTDVLMEHQACVLLSESNDPLWLLIVLCEDTRDTAAQLFGGVIQTYISCCHGDHPS